MNHKLTLLIMALCVLLCALLSGCSGGVVELSPEDEAAWEQDQAALYAGVQLSGFTAQTLDGKTVTAEDCFKDHTLTMVNIWGTFCGPCIDEMPALAKLYENRAEGVNIISICTDGGENEKNLAFAREVMEKAEAAFDTLLPDETLQQLLTDRTTSFPTTLFVDAQGCVVGEPHFGGHDEASYQGSIDAHLALLSAPEENAVAGEGA